MLCLLIYIPISTINYLPPPTSASSNNCNKEKRNSAYDYIVIGSGPGGATIATRLALNNFKVLLIEAGPDYDDDYTRIPELWPLNDFNPQITARFNPYLYSKQENISIEYPRGITLGGSAHINALFSMMANPSEWDDIADWTNDDDWSYNSIKRKYQPLIENCQYCSNNDPKANKNGWLNISLSGSQDLLSATFPQFPLINSLWTTINSTFKFNSDVNTDNTYDSYFYMPQSITQSTRIRSGPYKRLKNVQAARPSNLHIWTNSFVTKLIINPKTKEACGVQYINGSFLYKASPLSSPTLNSNDVQTFSIYTKREIIVSGGQWMSPQLLQLSGIGDRDLLNDFGIETIQHLPGVGKNQQDRNEVPFVLKLKNDSNLLALNTSLFSVLRSAEPKTKNFPDTIFFPITARFFGFRANWLPTLLASGPGQYLTLMIHYARVENNFGSVRIQSTNAFDTPFIELNHFKGKYKEIEINKIIQHIRFLRKSILEGPAAQYIEYEDLPGGHLTTDEQLTNYIKEYVSGHHVCCTNKMGDTKKDPLAVVNPKGQVKGIKNLRIADISIFPKMPGYFPTVPTYLNCIRENCR